MRSVLVVEDESRISGFLARALRADGLAVEVVADGDNGLRRAVDGGFDLVVLDLRLPGIDGVAVLQGIRQSSPHQPVLVLSAVNDTECRIRCLRLGASDYVTKPFQLVELLLRIRNSMERTVRAPGDRYLRAGRATLDLRHRTIDVGRGPVHLSEREFFLAQTLMSRAGEVCTREELLSEVWGYTFEADTNVLDVNIARLRSKVGSDTIDTVRNVGYCLVPP